MAKRKKRRNKKSREPAPSPRLGERPTVDFRTQAALGADVPPEDNACDVAFDLICETADYLHERSERRGVLIVIGNYAARGRIQNARGGLRTNPFEGKYVSAGDKFFQRMILKGDMVCEGAVMADSSGQILGAGIYLPVDHPTIDVPQGCFSRHITAASTSLRSDTRCIITLSEETNIARVFKKGTVVAEYDPAAGRASADTGGGAEVG